MLLNRPTALPSLVSQLAVQVVRRPTARVMMPRSDEVSATWEGDGKLGVTFMTDPDGVRSGPVRNPYFQDRPCFLSADTYEWYQRHTLMTAM
jgi:hypothetical protein